MSKIDLDDVDEGFLAFCWSNLSPRNRAKVMAGSPKTLWLFGAGASHHYDLNPNGVPVPLANGFFEAFNALPTSQGFHAFVGAFISFLGHHKGVKPREVSKFRENIEDFMTSVEEEIAQLREKKAKEQLDEQDILKGASLASVFNNMSFIFANVVNEAQNGPSESLYRYLLDFCGPNDAFITFNWDTLLDRALVDTGGWSPNEGYGLQFASVLDGSWKSRVEGAPKYPTNWKLLKLHGSTNWLVPYASVHPGKFDYISSVPKSDSIFLYWQSALPYETHKSRWRGGYALTCYCYYPSNIPHSYFSQEQLSPGTGRMWYSVTPVGVFSPFDEPSGDGIPASPLLITPVRQKSYDMYQTTINSLWQQAEDLLGTASKVVIVGYSFPPTDTRALKLLGNALAARCGEISVEIVAPDAAGIVSRIGEELLSKAKSVTSHDMKFEDYIQLLANDIPCLVKEAAAEYDEIREWIERIYFLNQAESL